MSFKVTVVIPSIYRPERLEKTLLSIEETSPQVEVIVVTHDDGTAYVAEKHGAKVVRVGDDVNAPLAWNMGAAVASGDAFVLGADDLIFKEGWLEASLRALGRIDGRGVVAFNDLSPNAGNLATHYLVTRGYAVNDLGGHMYCPAYRHYFGDMEITVRARRDGYLAYAEDAVVEHLHPLWDKAEGDEIYSLAQSFYEDDKAVYEAREKEGFPNVHKPYIEMLLGEWSGWGKVAVSARMYKYPEPDWVVSWTNMIAYGLRRGDNIITPVRGQPGHVAANIIARSFLDTNCHSLLLLDDDMEFPLDALDRLRNNVQNMDYDIAQGFCTHKTIPPHAVVLRLMEQPTAPLSFHGELYGALADIPDESVVDVDAVGLAFTLIKRHVIQDMVNGYGARHSSWFEWGRHTEGEDIVFSRICREHGFSMCVDTNVKIGHIGKYTYGWDSHQEWQRQENNR